MKNKGSYLVASSVIGAVFENVIINDKLYTIYPPTIARICGAAKWLNSTAEAKTIKDIVIGNDLMNCCRALSWFIIGNESLTETLSQGLPTEITDALETAYNLIDTRPFLKLSPLTKNIIEVIARQKQ